jgi:hypothetical protein
METPPHAEKRERMTDRVAKLLRQAEDAERSGRDEEMVAFQTKAFAIMSEYGIDEALARERQNGMNVKVDVKADSMYMTMSGKYKPVQAALFYYLAEAMHCKSIFVGGKIGSGQQGISWIHLDDAVRALTLCIDDETLPAKVNICSPNPARNEEVSAAIAKALHRPNWLTAPAFGMKP